MTSSNKVKGFAAGVIAAVCYGTNPLGTLELYGAISWLWRCLPW